MQIATPEVAKRQAVPSAVEDVLVERQQLRSLLAVDQEFFIEFFLGDEIPESGSVPELHVQMLQDMRSHTEEHQVYALPREHAKTTIARLSIVEHFLFEDWCTFAVYMGLAHELAIPSCTSIMDFFESDNFISLYGHIEYHTRQQGNGRYIFTIPNCYYSVSQQKWIDKRCILKAFGTGQSVRGLNEKHQRPRYIVMDDGENADKGGNIATPGAFQATKEWFYGTFIKGFQRHRYKFIQLGNLVATESLLGLHLEDPTWLSRHYGVLKEDGTPLWEALWTVEEIKADYLKYQNLGLTHLWLAEMMNIPSPGQYGLIRADEIQYDPPRTPGEAVATFITVDPAISSKNHAHESVICAHGFFRDTQRWQVLASDGQIGRGPIELFWDIVKMCLTWRCLIVGVEAVAYQSSLQQIFPYLCQAHGIPPVTFVPLNNRAPVTKLSRLKTWADTLKKTRPDNTLGRIGHNQPPPTNSLYALTRGDMKITQQLITYDTRKTANQDDAIDTACMGIEMQERYIDQILSASRGVIDWSSVGRPNTGNAKSMVQLSKI